MAKTKGKGLKVAEVDSEYIPSVYLDFEDPKDMSGLNVGGKVTVLVSGTIDSIRLEKGRSCLTLSPFECELESKGVYEELSEDD